MVVVAVVTAHRRAFVHASRREGVNTPANLKNNKIEKGVFVAVVMSK